MNPNGHFTFPEHDPLEAQSACFQRIRHARFLKPGVPYHFVCKTAQSFHLLAPDKQRKLRNIITGVLGRAQMNWPTVSLYAASFLSNHFHMIADGPTEALVAVLGFIKREISRRRLTRALWTGPLWDRYHATALITPEAQERCFRYVLGQGIKENLVATPAEWPGFHCAPVLMGNRRASGTWINYTRFGKAAYKERLKKNPRKLDPNAFAETYEVTFAKLPAWRHLSDAEYAARVNEVVNEEVEKARVERQGGKPLGAAAVCSTNPLSRGTVPLPSWFEERRRMIVWDNLNAPEVKAYLDEYWSHQKAFREASRRWLKGDLSAEFPPGSYRPGLPKPISEQILTA